MSHLLRLDIRSFQQIQSKHLISCKILRNARLGRHRFFKAYVLITKASSGDNVSLCITNYDIVLTFPN